MQLAAGNKSVDDCPMVGEGKWVAANGAGGGRNNQPLRGERQRRGGWSQNRGVAESQADRRQRNNPAEADENKMWRRRRRHVQLR